MSPAPQDMKLLRDLPRMRLLLLGRWRCARGCGRARVVRPRTRCAGTASQDKVETGRRSWVQGATSVGDASLDLQKCYWPSGEGGVSGPSVSNSEMLLARSPRPLGGWMSGDGVAAICWEGGAMVRWKCVRWHTWRRGSSCRNGNRRFT